MPQFDTLLFDKQGALGHISFNRPRVLNAYNIQMRDDFSEALAAVQDDHEVRALLITGQAFHEQETQTWSGRRSGRRGNVAVRDFP